MPSSSKTSRAQVWLESLGDWSWPGEGGVAAVEIVPPPWIPAFPPRSEAPAAAQPSSSRRRLALVLATAASALVAFVGAVSLEDRPALERALGLERDGAVAQIAPAPAPAPQLPTLRTVTVDPAGSTIDRAAYASAALRGEGSFYVYLPNGYAATTRHYPVVYLLHGNSQPASAFLDIGLQQTLDRLIAEHTIEPLIAVMIQGGPGANNWRNTDGVDYEDYVLEVQELVDRALPTVPTRAARAVAGDSMGGYGAMNVALGHPYRFAAVESWLGFFNGLDDELRAARPVLARLGLRAYLYGGAADHIADPAEDPAFAAQLRRAGASAHGVIYPGEHNMGTLEEHLASMLTYAGHAIGGTPVDARHR
jgi:hypothetical protein